MEILRSKEEKRILTGRIVGIEDEYYKIQNKFIPCAIIWHENTKVLIPITHLNVEKESKSLIRGMVGAEIDFIVIEYDSITNIAVASRTLAMELRKKIEIPKLKTNDVVRVRIVAVARKYIIVDLYGVEVTIKAENLRHTFIVNAKDYYLVGDTLIVKVKKIDAINNVFELSSKELMENPYKNIRKYITENGEYIAKI
ncbi:MAG: S1 RNA-binding domain-containing protein, partial [Clostridia bacterium]